VLAPGWESYQEALWGAPLATAYGGPVLLSWRTVLCSAVRDELIRLDPDYVLCIGLTSALVDPVLAVLQDAEIVSINGSDVYHMSYLLATELGDRVDVTGGDVFTATAIVTIGSNFPDTFGVGALACHSKWPVLLTDHPDGSPMNAWAVQAMNELGMTTYAKAGTYRPDPSGITGIGNLSGADRYETNANVANWSQSIIGLTFLFTGFATGDKFPDALASGSYLAQESGILPLSPLYGPLPKVIASALGGHNADVGRVTFIACIEPVIGQVKALLP